MSKQLVSDVTERFSFDKVAKIRRPLKVKTLSGAMSNTRVNHYLMKQKNSDAYALNEIYSPLMVKLLSAIHVFVGKQKLNIKDRYCYITVDTKPIKKGETQRLSGWHTDGFQGGEVKQKVDGDLYFTWANALPTQFAVQPFSTEGLDPKKHNVFKWLERQVDPKKIFQCQPNTLYAFSSYHVHRGVEAPKNINNRIFVRIGFTKVPITSVKLTVNTQVKYRYKIHRTTGEIPKHLV